MQNLGVQGDAAGARSLLSVTCRPMRSLPRRMTPIAKSRNGSGFPPFRPRLSDNTNQMRWLRAMRPKQPVPIQAYG